MSAPADARVSALRATLGRLSDGAATAGELERAAADLASLEDELAELRALGERSEARLAGILEVVLSLAMLDFGKRAEVGEGRDALDALALGVNIVAEELAASTSLVTNILDAMDDAVLTVNAGGAIVSANIAAARMLGHGVEELRGMAMSSVLASWASAHGPETLVRELADRDDDDAACLTKDGRTIPVSLSASPMRNARGELAGVVCVARDITQRKREEEERARLEEAVRTQAEAILEMSTPLIPITDDIVVMPLVGAVDPARAQRVVEALLAGVTRSRARVAILDVTGVPVVDTQVALGILRAVAALRLVGALAVLTGVRSDVARTLVALGVDMSGIAVEGTLKGGIARAARMLRRR